MTIAIIGPGLIGTSIALAARRADPAVQIIEIDRGAAITEATGADLIILATPVDVILEIIRDHSDVLRSSVTIDVGSTKRAIVAAARTADLPAFVGGHPMAGAATTGPGDARADLFDGRPWFLVPHGAADTALQTATQFIEQLGARPVVMRDDGAEHDRVMAAVSHLPQLVASALMLVAAQAAGDRLAWAGAGLRDTTRLAQSSGDVWQSIIDSNRDELQPLLRALARELERLSDRLGDGRSVGDLLHKANRARALL